MAGQASPALPPLQDAIAHALAKLVDDAQSPREPSHSELEDCFRRCNLLGGDPNLTGTKPVGKEKRVRSVLLWSLVNDEEAGRKCVTGLISLLRSKGAFRDSSPNFVGNEPIQNLAEEFKREGFELDAEGVLRPLMLDGLSGIALTEALASYVRRANRGSDDAALVTGTGKDLLEATAAHIVEQRFGGYNYRDNFPMLLGQAFTALGLTTSATPVAPTDTPQQKLQRALFEAASAVNTLRNKQGTGHGRPWLPTVSAAEARTAIQTMGIVAGLLLDAHQSSAKK